MGDLIEGSWQTEEERAYMRALDVEIVRLTRVVEALREAHACDRTNRARRRAGVIIQLSMVRRSNDA
jgi:hypothetical protein